MLLTLALFAAGQSAANGVSGEAAGAGLGPHRMEGAWNASVEVVLFDDDLWPDGLHPLYHFEALPTAEVRDRHEQHGEAGSEERPIR